MKPSSLPLFPDLRKSYMLLPMQLDLLSTSTKWLLSPLTPTQTKQILLPIFLSVESPQVQNFTFDFYPPLVPPNIFPPVIERYRKYLVCWHAKRLKKGVHLILLPSLLESLTTCIMSIFLITKKVLKTLDAFYHVFFWCRRIMLRLSESNCLEQCLGTEFFWWFGY